MTLPNGWALATVNDLGDYLNGMAFKPTDWGKDGIGIVRIQNLTDPKKPLNRTKRSFDERYRVRKGDLLVSWSATLDAFIWDRDDAILNQHIYKVTPTECVEPLFLYYQIRELIAELAGSEHLHGSTMKHINRGPFLAHPAPLPPIAEQRRIAAKLDALIARIRRARGELKRLPALHISIKNKILAECFPNGDQPSAVNLGDLLNGIESGKNMRCEERPPKKDELGVVKVSAVTWGTFDANQSKTLPCEYNPPEKARIAKGDLLISRANTLELVGAAVIVDQQPKNLFLSDKILRLVADNDTKEWILWFLRSPEGRRQIEKNATGNQLSMRNISQEAIRNLRLPFPDRQARETRLEEIRSTFARVNHIDTEATRSLSLLDKLESAILVKAFRGELVPQDPNDEPASVLLERIRANRAAGTSEKKVSKRGKRAAAKAS